MKKSARILAAAGSILASGSVLVAPFCSYAKTDNTATINVTIGQTLSLKINNSEEAVTTNIEMANKQLNEEKTHVLNVATNNPNGYTLTVIDQDTDNSLKRDESSSIPALSGTTLDANTASWGIKVKTPGAAGFGADYKAIPISTSDPLELYVNDGSNIETSDFNEDTTVQIGVATGDSPAGTYSDTIVYKVVGAL